MKTLILMLTLLSPSAFAQGPIPSAPVAMPAVASESKPAVPAAVAAEAKPVVGQAASETLTTAEGVAKLVDGDATTQDVIVNAEEVLAAYQAVKAADGNKARLFAILAGLAVAFKFLLSLLKVFVKANFWKGAKAKWILRLSAAGLGLAVFLCANLATGMPWFDALLLGLSGPGAIVIHEFTSKPRVADEKKA